MTKGLIKSTYCNLVLFSATAAGRPPPHSFGRMKNRRWIKPHKALAKLQLSIKITPDNNSGIKVSLRRATPLGLETYRKKNTIVV
jgi:hypothetical protein